MPPLGSSWLIDLYGLFKLWQVVGEYEGRISSKWRYWSVQERSGYINGSHQMRAEICCPSQKVLASFILLKDTRTTKSHNRGDVMQTDVKRKRTLFNVLVFLFLFYSSWTTTMCQQLLLQLITNDIMFFKPFVVQIYFVHERGLALMSKCFSLLNNSTFSYLFINWA